MACGEGPEVKTARVAKDWWRTHFHPRFYTPADRERLARAPKEAAFVARALGLKCGAAVLDLCCGPGRHAVLLAREGLRVTGLDYSRPYLREAESRARRMKAAVRFVRGDMRALPFRGEFDAVVNLFTSFGYFRRQGENLKVLAQARKALKPGGKFLIDVRNREALPPDFAQRSWEPFGRGFELVENYLLRSGRSVVLRRIRIRPGGRKSESSAMMHLYDKKTLSGMLGRAGLKPMRFWGDFSGSPWRKSSRRLIVLARKI
ncbi:MAG: class I SAM-dependent methyltransferase [Elusimicrobia bacterium]|nr:class I SAM-dependent methyltransferase [Elusimicrobiota bacterium]